MNHSPVTTTYRRYVANDHNATGRPACRIRLAEPFAATPDRPSGNAGPTDMGSTDPPRSARLDADRRRLGQDRGAGHRQEAGDQGQHRRRRPHPGTGSPRRPGRDGSAAAPPPAGSRSARTPAAARTPGFAPAARPRPMAAHRVRRDGSDAREAPAPAGRAATAAGWPPGFPPAPQPALRSSRTPFLEHMFDRHCYPAIGGDASDSFVLLFTADPFMTSSQQRGSDSFRGRPATGSGGHRGRGDLASSTGGWKESREHPATRSNRRFKSRGFSPVCAHGRQEPVRQDPRRGRPPKQPPKMSVGRPSNAEVAQQLEMAKITQRSTARRTPRASPPGSGAFWSWTTPR